ncbi:hypothetical protein MFRU_009g03510 [Monilinia fructicola]|nr:hypothetical protein MFRU_009g03510 [Monilinia fructicola]
MSMILVKFNRIPTPPLTVDSSNAHESQPWYEALQITHDPDASRQWQNLATSIVSSMRSATSTATTRGGTTRSARWRSGGRWARPSRPRRSCTSSTTSTRTWRCTRGSIGAGAGAGAAVSISA